MLLFRFKGANSSLQLSELRTIHYEIFSSNMAFVMTFCKIGVGPIAYLSRGLDTIQHTLSFTSPMICSTINKYVEVGNIF